MQSTDTPATGLRERKKARTRLAIQHAALILIRENGYEATTVEQIAEAAEISPSTFFRYFPTKEEVVLSDEYDPFVIDAFHRQPPELRATEALRRAMMEAFVGLDADELVDFEERVRLIFLVPELRSAASDRLFMQSFDEVVALLAERVGREADDIALRTLAGAILGVSLATMYRWAASPGRDLIADCNEALTRLDSAFPF